MCLQLHRWGEGRLLDYTRAHKREITEKHTEGAQQRVEEQEYRREGLQDKNKALKSQN